MARYDTFPWQYPEPGDRERLSGNLLVPKGVERKVVVPVLRAAVDLALGWVGVDLTWSTSVFVAGEGAPSQASSFRRRLDWDFVSGRPGSPTWISLKGVCTQLAADPLHPGHRVVNIDAHFPEWSEFYGRDLGRMLVSVSVQRWALYGSGTQLPRFTPALDRWMVDGADRLGAAGGFALLDAGPAFVGESPWERRTYAKAEAASQVWGYGWGTLLGPEQLDRIGGAGSITALPGARVQELSGGRLWLTLGDDPSAVRDHVMFALHEALLPALPSRRVLGSAHPSALHRPPPLDPASAAAVRARWSEQQARLTRAGRTDGTLGPVGFTLGLLDVLLPMADDVREDTFRVRGLVEMHAAALLDRLPDGVLDARRAGCPSLRRALQAVVDHPGQLSLSGVVVGPGREDEDLVLDKVVLRQHLRMSGRPDWADETYALLVELGVDDATEAPVIAAPTGERGWVFVFRPPETVRDLLAEPHPFEGMLTEADVPRTPTTFAELRHDWQRVAEAARTSSRATGMHGPVGLMLDVLNALAPTARDLAHDSFVVDGLTGPEASRVLDTLPSGMLDAHDGDGPTLRRALEAAAAHPGGVRLSGLAIGPGREDERLLVDTVAVAEDDVLRRLGPRQAKDAYARLVAIGVDDAARPPDRASRSRDRTTWTFWWD
ncbi:MAG: hypothetical protein BGO38_02305 [Cellulomonas sp. 73-145]|uniref:hypothetical protein n=1 Tax=Cellulomonas sp. 73-145 TaxID=1895739 RepID=UPI000928DF65|nr:hypothetical protein [Cellulomonas sp. 73-145]OJV56814.1 MAG: hypothetical protein BGO38_02305 [Cellulomonas sp. 73-145]